MTDIVSQVLADLQEQLRVAGEDSKRREAVIVEGLARLPAATTGTVPRVWRDDVDCKPVVEDVLNDAPGAMQSLRAATYEPGAPRAVVRDWSKVAPPREWLVLNWLPRGRVALLTGEGGRGKSLLALQLAAAVAAGDPVWLSGGPNLAISNTKTAVIATWEDEADEISRRLSPVFRSSVGDRLHVADFAGSGPLWEPDAKGSRHISTLGALSDAGVWLRAWCERHEAGLLIVDPLAAAYACNENDRGLVRAFMASWDAWARDTGCTVLLIAHPPKTDAAYSGSTDWHAAARAVWTLSLCETGTGDATGKGGGKEKREPATAPCLQCLKSSYSLLPIPLWVERNGNWRVAQDAGAAARRWADGKLKAELNSAGRVPFV